MQLDIKFAGFGGQGIMLAGQFLAYAGLLERKEVVWLPSYGPEMRGGTAYCTVVVSDTKIASPIVEYPSCLVVMNKPSFTKFVPLVKKSGIIVVNESLIDFRVDRKDVREILVQANRIAIDLGTPKTANMVMLGALIGATNVIKLESIKKVVIEKLQHKKELIDVNFKSLEIGFKIGAS